MNKNILIAIDNGIIALDVKRQLKNAGYNAEITNVPDKEKIKEALTMNFHLIIFEKSSLKDELEYAAWMARKYEIPTIFLSSDINNERINQEGFRILMMPFAEDELKEIVKFALDED